jgi:hypothetical protein
VNDIVRVWPGSNVTDIVDVVLRNALLPTGSTVSTSIVAGLSFGLLSVKSALVGSFSRLTSKAAAGSKGASSAF